MLALIPVPCVFIQCWTVEYRIYFLENLGSHLHDGVEVFFELLDEWGIVITYLFDDKDIGAPCLVDVHAFLCKFCQHIFSQVVDVLGLDGYLISCFHRVEVAVDESFSLLQITLVEWISICC